MTARFFSTSSCVVQGYSVDFKELQGRFRCVSGNYRQQAFQRLHESLRSTPEIFKGLFQEVLEAFQILLQSLAFGGVLQEVSWAFQRFSRDFMGVSGHFKGVTGDFSEVAVILKESEVCPKKFQGRCQVFRRIQGFSMALRGLRGGYSGVLGGFKGFQGRLSRFQRRYR